MLIQRSDSTEKVVLGVVADYNHRTLTHRIEPLALLYATNIAGVMQVSYSGSPEAARQTIEKAWAAVNPGVKIDYSDIKGEVNRFYELIFRDLVSILSFISVLAVVLSCLGLLVMAAYSTET